MNEIKLQRLALRFTDGDEIQEWDEEEFKALPCDWEKTKD